MTYQHQWVLSCLPRPPPTSRRHGPLTWGENNDFFFFSFFKFLFVVFFNFYPCSCAPPRAAFSRTGSGRRFGDRHWKLNASQCIYYIIYIYNKMIFQWGWETGASPSPVDNEHLKTVEWYCCVSLGGSVAQLLMWRTRHLKKEKQTSVLCDVPFQDLVCFSQHEPVCATLRWKTGGRLDKLLPIRKVSLTLSSIQGQPTFKTYFHD